jgi:hypothetical protein
VTTSSCGPRQRATTSTITASREPSKIYLSFNDLYRRSTTAVIAALGCAPESYTLAWLRYDLSKLRAKGLVVKLPNSRRYQLLPQGYSICLIFLKLFERVYAPLTAGLLSPSKQMSGSNPKGDLNSTASTSVSSTISIASSELSA